MQCARGGCPVPPLRGWFLVTQKRRHLLESEQLSVSFSNFLEVPTGRGLGEALSGGAAQRPFAHHPHYP